MLLDAHAVALIQTNELIEAATRGKMVLRLLEERALAGVHLEGLDLATRAGRGCMDLNNSVHPSCCTMAIGS